MSFNVTGASPPSTSSGSSSSSSTSSTSSSSSSSSSSSEDEVEESLTDETKFQFIEAKKQYRDLKMKLLQSIKENEILTDELRRHQRKLLRLNRDKYFLFERLLPYEKPPPKQTAPKEETIEIVDGVPKVIRVGKKRGPKPKKREKSPLPMSPFFNSPPNICGSMEPGQSLLKLKGGQKKRGPKKKEGDTMSDQSLTGSPTSSSGNVTFSPGFSKDKKSTLKRQQLQKEIVKSPQQQHLKVSQMFHHQSSPPPPLELSNSTTQDSMISFKSDVVDRSEFFRHDSFSNEMPDNLFDD